MGKGVPRVSPELFQIDSECRGSSADPLKAIDCFHRTRHAKKAAGCGRFFSEPPFLLEFRRFLWHYVEKRRGIRSGGPRLGARAARSDLQSRVHGRRPWQNKEVKYSREVQP